MKHGEGVLKHAGIKNITKKFLKNKKKIIIGTTAHE